MKKYTTLICNMDEIKEAMTEYLKGKNICIPSDATVDAKGTYVVVSYAENVDKAEDKPQVSADPADVCSYHTWDGLYREV